MQFRAALLLATVLLTLTSRSCVGASDNKSFLREKRNRSVISNNALDFSNIFDTFRSVLCDLLPFFGFCTDPEEAKPETQAPVGDTVFACILDANNNGNGRFRDWVIHPFADSSCDAVCNREVGAGSCTSNGDTITNASALEFVVGSFGCSCNNPPRTAGIARIDGDRCLFQPTVDPFAGCSTIFSGPSGYFCCCGADCPLS